MVLPNASSSSTTTIPRLIRATLGAGQMARTSSRADERQTAFNELAHNIGGCTRDARDRLKNLEELMSPQAYRGQLPGRVRSDAEGPPARALLALNGGVILHDGALYRHRISAYLTDLIALVASPHDLRV
jgi:hypothetical protein